MRIEPNGQGFLIVKGQGKRESYFCFLVDNDRSCWTSKRAWDARIFKRRMDADLEIGELRRRDKIRRSEQA